MMPHRFLTGAAWIRLLTHALRRDEALAKRYAASAWRSALSSHRDVALKRGVNRTVPAAREVGGHITVTR